MLLYVTEPEEHPIQRRQQRRPNGAQPLKPLQVRVEPELLDRAKARAAERGETLSAAVVDMLRKYVR